MAADSFSDQEYTGGSLPSVEHLSVEAEPFPVSTSIRSIMAAIPFQSTANPAAKSFESFMTDKASKEPRIRLTEPPS